jgi:hypothetical protein
MNTKPVPFFKVLLWEELRNEPLLYRLLPKNWIPTADLPLDTRFGQWRRAVAEGWLPAVIFGATQVGGIKSGQAYLLATTDIPGSDKMIFGAGKGRYDAADILVATAARLSATFSYVSPMAIASYDTPRRTL